MPTIRLSFCAERKNCPQAEEFRIKILLKKVSETLKSCGFKVCTKDSPCKNRNALNLMVYGNRRPGPIPKAKSGINIFFMEGSPESARAAKIFKLNLEKIYHDQNSIWVLSSTNEKDPKDATLPFMSIGLGYLDSLEDLRWIKTNMDAISRNIAMSACEFFGVPFIGNKIFKKGAARTCVNIFERPSVKAARICCLMAGDRVTVLGKWENWFAVKRGAFRGYVPDMCVEIIK